MHSRRAFVTAAVAGVALSVLPHDASALSGDASPAKSTASSRIRPTRNATGTRLWQAHAALPDARPRWVRVNDTIAVRACCSRFRKSAGVIAKASAASGPPAGVSRRARPPLPTRTRAPIAANYRAFARIRTLWLVRRRSRHLAHRTYA